MAWAAELPDAIRRKLGQRVQNAFHQDNFPSVRWQSVSSRRQR
jgi:hypothetical protein